MDHPPQTSEKYSIRAPSPANFNEGPIPVHTEEYHGAYKPEHNNARDLETQGLIVTGSNTSIENPKKYKSRICGLKRSLFLILVAVLVVIGIGAIVGGVVAGVLSSRKTSTSSSTNSISSSGSRDSATTTTTRSAPTATTTPLNIASVNRGDNMNTIETIHQDAATNNLYISKYDGTRWLNPLKLDGLNPQPRADTPLAAMRYQDSELVSLLDLNRYSFANVSDLCILCF